MSAAAKPTSSFGRWTSDDRAALGDWSCGETGLEATPEAKTSDSTTNEAQFHKDASDQPGARSTRSSLSPELAQPGARSARFERMLPPRWWRQARWPRGGQEFAVPAAIAATSACHSMWASTANLTIFHSVCFQTRHEGTKFAPGSGVWACVMAIKLNRRAAPFSSGVRTVLCGGRDFDNQIWQRIGAAPCAGRGRRQHRLHHVAS